MQSQLYAKSKICQPVTSIQAPSTSLQALGALMLMGVNFRVLGRAPIPKGEIRKGNWLAKPWRSDISDLPQAAWRPLVELNQKGITPLDIWVFHELSISGQTEPEKIRSN